MSRATKLFLAVKFENLARILSDIDQQELEALIEKYGEPTVTRFEADFLEFECELVRRSAQKGRNHDITCFIECNDGYVVIQKHAYAKSGIYRAPSGGAQLGERIEEAALREMHEETGLDIALKRFILDSHLNVVCADGSIPWRSLVFLAEVMGGKMEPVDTYEIYDVQVMTRDELLTGVDKLMEASGWGGFKYRAFLTRSFFDELDRVSKG
jgi:8-oxo-dGTP pyrophosphatase MutT (NUDIX family)